jgi:hypothetical protein
VHALSRPHAHSILGNPIEYTFRFCPGRSKAAVAREPRFLDKAHQRPGPRPAWKLLPHSPVLLFPFNTQNRGVQDAAATIGWLADSSKQGRPNTSKQQVRTNMQELDTISFFSDTRITEWSQNRTKPDLLLEAIQFFCVTWYQIVLLFLLHKQIWS